MLNSIIPGHMRANTWCRILVIALTVGILTGSWGTSIMGAIVVGLGSFMSDQTTHLQQPAHSERAPTWFEHCLQQYPKLGRVSGWILEAAGLLVLFYGIS